MASALLFFQVVLWWPHLVSWVQLSSTYWWCLSLYFQPMLLPWTPLGCLLSILNLLCSDLKPPRSPSALDLPLPSCLLLHFFSTPSFSYNQNRSQKHCGLYKTTSHHFIISYVYITIVLWDPSPILFSFILLFIVFL